MRWSTVWLLSMSLVAGLAFAAPTTARTQSDAEAAAAARATAEELFELAAQSNFNALFDRIHPDAHAVIPRVAAIRAFEEIYATTQAGLATITGVAIGEWTWQVTGKTYPDAAQVRFAQPYVDQQGREQVSESEMYLVPYEGEWRWFFGSDRAYIAEIIGRFDPPPPAEAPGDTRALLELVVGDLDRFYRGALDGTQYRYETPGIVVVDEGQVAESGCGGVVQPGFWAFYCPLDQTVYLDLPFLRDLEQRYGDFAAAFVVGHEWSHHSETAIGMERSPAPTEFNEVYSIELELLADCLTGVWARDADTRGLIEITDIAEAFAFIRERLGDPAGVDPADPQAHGSAEDRVDAFLDGYDGGFYGCEEVF